MIASGAGYTQPSSVHKAQNHCYQHSINVDVLTNQKISRQMW